MEGFTNSDEEKEKEEEGERRRRKYSPLKKYLH